MAVGGYHLVRRKTRAKHAYFWKEGVNKYCLPYGFLKGSPYPTYGCRFRPEEQAQAYSAQQESGKNENRTEDYGWAKLVEQNVGKQNPQDCQYHSRWKHYGTQNFPALDALRENYP